MEREGRTKTPLKVAKQNEDFQRDWVKTLRKSRKLNQTVHRVPIPQMNVDKENYNENQTVKIIGKKIYKKQKIDQKIFSEHSQIMPCCRKNKKPSPKKYKTTRKRNIKNEEKPWKKRKNIVSEQTEAPITIYINTDDFESTTNDTNENSLTSNPTQPIIITRNKGKKNKRRWSESIRQQKIETQPISNDFNNNLGGSPMHDYCIGSYTLMNDRFSFTQIKLENIQEENEVDRLIDKEKVKDDAIEMQNEFKIQHKAEEEAKAIEKQKELEARLNVEKEAKIKAELEAKLKEEEKNKAIEKQKELESKAKLREAIIKAEEEAKAIEKQKELEARLNVEKEAKIKAELEAKLKRT